MARTRARNETHGRCVGRGSRFPGGVPRRLWHCVLTVPPIICPVGVDSSTTVSLYLSQSVLNLVGLSEHTHEGAVLKHVPRTLHTRSEVNTACTVYALRAPAGTLEENWEESARGGRVDGPAAVARLGVALAPRATRRDAGSPFAEQPHLRAARDCARLPHSGWRRRRSRRSRRGRRPRLGRGCMRGSCRVARAYGDAAEPRREPGARGSS